jgi:hypothetical protein
LDNLLAKRRAQQLESELAAAQPSSTRGGTDESGERGSKRLREVHTKHTGTETVVERKASKTTPRTRRRDTRSHKPKLPPDERSSERSEGSTKVIEARDGKETPDETPKDDPKMEKKPKQKVGKEEGELERKSSFKSEGKRTNSSTKLDAALEEKNKEQDKEKEKDKDKEKGQGVCKVSQLATLFTEKGNRPREEMGRKKTRIAGKDIFGTSEHVQSQKFTVDSVGYRPQEFVRRDAQKRTNRRMGQRRLLLFNAFSKHAESKRRSIINKFTQEKNHLVSLLEKDIQPTTTKEELKETSKKPDPEEATSQQEGENKSDDPLTDIETDPEEQELREELMRQQLEMMAEEDIQRREEELLALWEQEAEKEAMNEVFYS